jgi:hypothetical protein
LRSSVLESPEWRLPTCLAHLLRGKGYSVSLTAFEIVYSGGSSMVKQRQGLVEGWRRFELGNRHIGVLRKEKVVRPVRPTSNRTYRTRVSLAPWRIERLAVEAPSQWRGFAISGEQKAPAPQLTHWGDCAMGRTYCWQRFYK